MPHISLGRVNIDAAGTPVQVGLAANIPTGKGSLAEGLRCQSYQIQADPANTAIVYIGTSALVKATRVGVHAILPKPADTATGPFPSQSFSVPFAANYFNLADVYIDGATNDGVIVTLIQT